MEYTQVEGVHTKVLAAKGTPFERSFEGELISVEPYVVASQGGDPEMFFGRHRWELTEVDGGTRLVNVAQTREVLVAEFDAFNQALLQVFAR